MSLRALAYDTASGREVVNVEVFRTRSAAAGSIRRTRARRRRRSSRATASTCISAPAGTAALTTTGEIVWKTQFAYESQHGAGGLPVLYGDVLILNCDGSDTAFVVALDKRTGKTRWKTSRRQPWDQAYTTPLVIRAGDRDQVVSVGAFRAASYDPSIGERNLAGQLRRWLLERAPARLWQRSRLHHDRFLPARDPGSAGRRKRRCHQDTRAVVASPRGTIDAFAAPRRQRAVRGHRQRHCVVCRCERQVRSSGSGVSMGRFRLRQVFADGRIYFLAEDGVATVIAPGREFSQLAVNRLDGATLASMALSSSPIYIRSATHLYGSTNADCWQNGRHARVWLAAAIVAAVASSGWRGRRPESPRHAPGRSTIERSHSRRKANTRQHSRCCGKRPAWHRTTRTCKTGWARHSSASARSTLQSTPSTCARGTSRVPKGVEQPHPRAGQNRKWSRGNRARACACRRIAERPRPLLHPRPRSIRAGRGRGNRHVPQGPGALATAHAGEV